MKYLTLLMLFIAFTFPSGATNNSCEIMAKEANTVMYMPQVCQFSLTNYSGKINGGFTGSFQVGLSCPQEYDVRATVVVFINGEHIASKIVTIKAGKEYSESLVIHVGSDFNGESYKLVVQ